MPSIDDLIKEYQAEIKEETEQYRGILQSHLSREPIRRPWDAGQPTPPPEAPAAVAPPAAVNPPPPPEIPAAPEPVAAAAPSPEVTPDEPVGAPPRPEKPPVWYGSWPSIRSAIGKNQRTLLFTFAFSLIVLIGLSQLIPTTYSSSLHLYSPEKTDSIGSRLSLFSGRVEFASFPVDFKIPMGLIARRLKSPVARDWVLNRYHSVPHYSVEAINPALTRAETFYAEGSELLVIQGYSNHPKIASEITNLYWDYLENEVQKMRNDHLAKVSQWIELTSTTIQQRMKDDQNELNRLSGTPMSDSRQRVNAKLGESYSDAEVRRLQLQKEVDSLSSAVAVSTLDAIWMVPNPEIQDLRQVDEALKRDEVSLSPEQKKVRRLEIENRAIKIAHKLLEDKKIEIAAIKDQSAKLRIQLDASETSDRDRAKAERQRELVKRQSDYQTQLDELERLRAQIRVETSLVASRLKPIQAAATDYSSRRPMVAVKYAVCLAISLFLCMIVLVGLQLSKQSEEQPKNESVLAPLRQPHATGLGA